MSKYAGYLLASGVNIFYNQYSSCGLCHTGSLRAVSLGNRALCGNPSKGPRVSLWAMRHPPAGDGQVVAQGRAAREEEGSGQLCLLALHLLSLSQGILGRARAPGPGGTLLPTQNSGTGPGL